MALLLCQAGRGQPLTQEGLHRMSDDTRPLYTIAMAAELLAVHPRTLRLYEAAGLLKPARRNNRRLYSKNDLMWARCIRFLIHEKGLNQEGLRRLLAQAPCWEIKGCAPDEYHQCGAFQDRTCPCWTLSESSRRHHNGRCNECEVYLQAPDRVCCKEEMMQASTFGPDLPI
jgi:MerR family transcriptional regulator, heat shock protein HspR